MDSKSGKKICSFSVRNTEPDDHINYTINIRERNTSPNYVDESPLESSNFNVGTDIECVNNDDVEHIEEQFDIVGNSDVNNLIPGQRR